MAFKYHYGPKEELNYSRKIQAVSNNWYNTWKARNVRSKHLINEAQLGNRASHFWSEANRKRLGTKGISPDPYHKICHFKIALKVIQGMPGNRRLLGLVPPPPLIDPLFIIALMPFLRILEQLMMVNISGLQVLLSLSLSCRDINLYVKGVIAFWLI